MPAFLSTWSTAPSDTTSNGTSYWAWTSTATTTIEWRAISNTTCATTFATPMVMVIDPEDLVNHAEYFELARARGITFRIRTAEEKAREEREAAERAAERQRREAMRLEARARARSLLLEHLTPAQRETFEKNNWFLVTGGKSGTQYRVRTGGGVAGNVDVLAGERVSHRLCCHCFCDVPDYDQFLAQKLALMFDEEHFLRTANRHAA